MNKVYLSLLSFASLSLVNLANAADAPTTQPQQAASQFNPEQVADTILQSKGR